LKVGSGGKKGRYLTLGGESREPLLVLLAFAKKGSQRRGRCGVIKDSYT